MKLEITKLRKKIYKNLKEKAYSYETPNPEVNKYLRDQRKYAKRDFEVSTIENLNLEVLKSNCIFLGDFHTFDQNIRNVLRIIKILLNEKRECIIALEMVDAKYQFYLDSYLDHHLTDLEFLECIDYHDSWRFPWTHYKLIFELAKKHKLPIIALNTDGPLKERDLFAAELLSRIYKQNPKKKLLVLYGELHITKNKIPALLKLRVPQIKDIIIHQNLDEVYWKLIEKNIEIGITKFSPSEFCIVSAPPWIKYESMIYWYENLCDDPDFDIHEYIIENGKKVFNNDIEDDFILICSELIKHLGLDLSTDDIQDFNLYDHSNLEYVEEKIRDELSKKLFTFYQYLIYTNQSFRLPHKSNFYCSSYSMNRISYLAGIHILHYYLEKSGGSPFKILKSTKKEDQYILFIMQSMFAFFFSKVINPHRKCDMYQDIVLKVSKSKLDQEKKTLTLVINTLATNIFFNNISDYTMREFHQSSLYVGHILGEYLYDFMLKPNSLQKLESDFLKIDLNAFTFNRIKNLLLKDQDFKQHNKRYY